MVINTKKLVSFVAFLIPVLTSVKINIIGHFFPGEILTTLMLPSVILHIGFYWNSKHIKILLVMLTLWSLSLMLTDIIRETDFTDYSRGWAKQLFLMINIIVFYNLFKGSKLRIYYAFLGLGIFYLFNGYLAYSNSDIPQMWKFGLGNGMALLILSFSAVLLKNTKQRRYIIFNTGLLLLLGIISLFLNSRSLGGMFLMSSGALWILSNKKLNRQKHKKKNILMLCVWGGGLIFSTLMVYDIGAPRGWFGDKTARKYEMQYIKGFGPFGIILGARSEFLVASQAIADSPFIGHGSWAKDVKYRIMLIRLRYQMNDHAKKETAYNEISNLIPSHSHLLGAWVEAGFLGAVFWVLVLMLFVRLTQNWEILSRRIQPILAFLIIWSIWDILFSPFGGERRIFWGVVLALLLFLLDEVKEKQMNSKNCVDAKR